MSDKLRFAVPNGSLWARLRMHLEHAGYPLRDPDRTGFCGEFGGIEFVQVDRRMLPFFLKSGAFDAGLTGADLWINSKVEDMRSISTLCFSRSTDQPSRWVMAKRQGFELESKERLVVACELDGLAQQLLPSVDLPRPVDLFRIDGSEEMVVKHGVADLVMVVTETGSSIKANALQILPGCDQLMQSMPEIRAQNGLPTVQEERLQELSLVLQAFVGAGVYTMVSFDILVAVNLARLELPASVAPTITGLTDPDWRACQICVPRRGLPAILLKLKRAGAQGVVIHDVNGYIA